MRRPRRALRMRPRAPAAPGRSAPHGRAACSCQCVGIRDAASIFDGCLGSGSVRSGDGPRSLVVARFCLSSHEGLSDAPAGVGGVDAPSRLAPCHPGNASSWGAAEPGPLLEIHAFRESVMILLSSVRLKLCEGSRKRPPRPPPAGLVPWALHTSPRSSFQMTQCRGWGLSKGCSLLTGEMLEGLRSVSTCQHTGVSVQCQLRELSSILYFN